MKKTYTCRNYKDIGSACGILSQQFAQEVYVPCTRLFSSRVALTWIPIYLCSMKPSTDVPNTRNGKNLPATAAYLSQSIACAK